VAGGKWQVIPSPVCYEVEYFAPAVGGDRVEIHSRVVAVGATQLTWAHEIRRDQERLVEARATICLEDVGEVSVPLPAGLLEVL
jgi:acyl-CoA thioesterase FadM